MKLTLVDFPAGDMNSFIYSSIHINKDNTAKASDKSFDNSIFKNCTNRWETSCVYRSVLNRSVVACCCGVVTDLEERKKERAPEFLSNFGDTLVLEGMDCDLSLSYVGYPQPDITWLYNGQEISKSDIYDMTVRGDTARLRISRATADLTGDYSCRLRNKFGMTEVVARVTVGVRPQLIERPDHLDVTVGDEAKFDCKYKGLPTPEVFWYHNKLPLTVS